MVCLARKPISENTIVENVIKWGTGGLSIDECRVDYISDKDKELPASLRPNVAKYCHDNNNIFKSIAINKTQTRGSMKGRFPANVIHDGSDEVLELFPNTSKAWGKATNGNKENNKSVFGIGGVNANRYDEGGSSAARFFYCAKANSP